MEITRMRCNRIANPLGFAMDQPRLSWVTETLEASTQEACQVQVAPDEGFTNILFDSGKREDIDSIGFVLPLELKPRTRYYWRVKVWANGMETESPVAWFETSKMDEPWQAQWITPEDPVAHPLLRKEFSIEGDIAFARAYVSGLGLYELEINGKRVGDEYLTPYCNAYDKWIQYQTYDVTDLLKQGKNGIGAMLGNGWYKGRFGSSGHQEGIYGDKFALLCELIVTFKDGSTQVIGTDTSWKSTASPVLDSSIYDGEVQDANKVIPGWSSPELDDADWAGVVPIDIGFDRLEARRSVPVRIMEELKPIEVITTPKGETVLDMGQNMVGWVRMRVNAPKGTKIFLQYGEVLQEGNFFRDNLRTAKAEFTYISDGQPAVVEPHFTFYGFRYVKVEGWPGELNPEDFTGCVVYSDMDRIGTIETSNPLVNRLFLNALWGQKGNFLDVPTDCPQRDERMGWTGDAHVFSGTACFNMDTAAFFHKYLYDLAREQEERNGAVPFVVPTFAMGKEGNFGGEGSTVWGDAATVIPWNLYLHYGDKAILEQQLYSMKAWVDYIRSKDDGSRLWNTGFHFGDWLALDGADPFSPIGGTPNDLIATAYYHYSAGLVSKAAAVLGEKGIAEEYGQLASEIKEAFQREFLTPNGRLAVDTQTAYVLVLFMDLVPEQFRKRAVDSLRRKLAEKNNHLTTGFVGTPLLCRVLSENGSNDLAYRLLMNDDFPSWLYAVKMGATTIWERWNSLLPDGKIGELSMNSLNHYAYGSIVEWMYRNMCGLNPVEDAPGFRKVRLAPQPFGYLQSAKAVLDSAAGRYESGWRIEEDGLHYEFRIPFNASADLILPDARLADVTVNGKALGDTGLSAREQDGKVMIELPTGCYTIHYVPTKDYIIRYSTQMTPLELLSHPKVKEVLAKHLPQMVERAGGMMGRFGSVPLRELAKSPMARIPEELLDKIDDDLKEIKGWDL
jgi:alpha-L-rhamnosidase